jgi:chromosome segregation protein
MADKKKAGAAATAAPALDQGQLIDTLKSQLAARTDQLMAAEAAAEAAEARAAALERALADSGLGARAASEESARRAKEREAILQAELAASAAECSKLRAAHAAAKALTEEVRLSGEQECRARASECSALRSRMNDLAAEFELMLQALVAKLQERVELVQPAVESSGTSTAENQKHLLKAMQKAASIDP